MEIDCKFWVKLTPALKSTTNPGKKIEIEINNFSQTKFTVFLKYFEYSRRTRMYFNTQCMHKSFYTIILIFPDIFTVELEDKKWLKSSKLLQIVKMSKT